MRWALLIVSALVSTSAAAADEDEVEKADLSRAEAQAEILAQEERGLLIKTVDVKSDGKNPKFRLVFAKGLPGGQFHLAASHAQLDGTAAEAREHGGVVLVQLKGYSVGGRVYFAYVTREIAPAGSGVGMGVYRDVPPPDYDRLVREHRDRGWMIADYSTYVAPDKRTYHTVVFHPR